MAALAVFDHIRDCHAVTVANDQFREASWSRLPWGAVSTLSMMNSAHTNPSTVVVSAVLIETRWTRA
jgi:hypothetical protein